MTSMVRGKLAIPRMPRNGALEVDHGIGIGVRDRGEIARAGGFTFETLEVLEHPALLARPEVEEHGAFRTIGHVLVHHELAHGESSQAFDASVSHPFKPNFPASDVNSFPEFDF